MRISTKHSSLNGNRRRIRKNIRTIGTNNNNNKQHYQLLEIDNQKKRDDPSFKGAFHEKKKETLIKIAKAAELKAKKEKKPVAEYSRKSKTGSKTPQRKYGKKK